MSLYVLLMMRIYVLLVMGIRSVVRMGMTTSSMVVSHMVMSTRNRVTCIITRLRVVRVATMMVWVHCVCMVYVVMGRVVSTRSMVMTVIHMMWGCMVTIVCMRWSRMVSWAGRMRSNRVVGCFCSRGSRGSSSASCSSSASNPRCTGSSTNATNARNAHSTTYSAYSRNSRYA